MLVDTILIAPLRVQEFDLHVALHLVVGDGLMAVGADRCVRRKGACFAFLGA